MLAIYIALLSIIGAFSCDVLCKTACDIFNAKSSCFIDCRCQPELQEKIADFLQAEYYSLLAQSGCLYILSNACDHDLEFEFCMAKAGCSNTTNLQWLTSNIPQYLWKAVRPAHIKRTIDNTIEMDKCSDCQKKVGEKYWECIDNFCKSYDESNELPLNRSPEKTKITKEIIEALSNTIFHPCDCYKKCEENMDQYESCFSKCNIPE